MWIWAFAKVGPTNETSTIVLVSFVGQTLSDSMWSWRSRCIGVQNCREEQAGRLFMRSAHVFLWRVLMAFQRRRGVVNDVVFLNVDRGLTIADVWPHNFWLSAWKLSG